MSAGGRRAALARCRDGGPGTELGRACRLACLSVLGEVRSLFEHPLAVLGAEAGGFG